MNSWQCQSCSCDSTDTLLEAAIEIVKKNDNISTSMLQRRLRLGYPRHPHSLWNTYTNWAPSKTPKKMAKPAKPS